MKPLMFKCPTCLAYIQADIENILRTDFACGRCGNRIEPHQIFDGEELSFPDTMAQYIAEAACNYGRMWLKEYAYYKEHGVRNMQMAQLTSKFNLETIRRIVLFFGGNWDELGIGEVGDLLGLCDEGLESVERLRGTHSGGEEH